MAQTKNSKLIAAIVVPIVVALIGGAALILSSGGHEKLGRQKVLYTIRVSDNTGGRVEQASLTLQAGGQNLNGFSDSDGKHIFAIDAPSEKEEGLLQVEKLNYAKLNVEVPIPNSDDTYQARLTPEQVQQPGDQGKTCTGEKQSTFGPGNNKTGSNYGPGGGGTTLDGWSYSFTAPSRVTSVKCTPTGGWERVLTANREGNVATCTGWINGGNAPVVMDATWEEPCK